MPLPTEFARMLGLAHPIIQAPMAGGGDTPDLVTAVCEAGGLGSIGAAYLTPSQIQAAAKAVKSRTNRPFAVNLFAPLPAPDTPSNIEIALKWLAPFYQELGLSAPTYPSVQGSLFDEQLAAVLDTRPAVFSFTFGMLATEAIKAIKAQGVFLIGTATTLAEAVALEQAGVDAVVAQGSEAGGHRGTFLVGFEEGLIGTMALVPQIVDAVKIPVLASGGIMDGRGIAAALALGASGVQLGTAFLMCHEAGVPQAYKDAVLFAREDQTRLTRAFSGRPARGIVNRFLTAGEQPEAAEAILPFPLQNVLTRPLRKAAGERGKAEFLSLWAGQGLRLARCLSARELMAKLADETTAAIEGLRALGPLGKSSAARVARQEKRE